MRRTRLIVVLLLVSAACTDTGNTTTSATATTLPSTTTSTSSASTTFIAEPVAQAVFDPGGEEAGITIDSGGDVDYELVEVGTPAQPAVKSGNGTVLSAPDGNDVADFYLQFQVDDDLMFEAQPTSRVQIEVEYLDVGTDTFGVQYDAVAGGVYGDGTFKDTGAFIKTNTGVFQTAVFSLCDAYFANRDNGADFRIADGDDGAEIIRRVAVTLLAQSEAPRQIFVDSCGANPFDDLPDSEAIQTCVDQTCDGDTVVFTSGVSDPQYQGYAIDKTVFLARAGSRRDLTFTSTNPDDHALLSATPDLLGFVVRLYARSGIADSGYIDNVTISHVDLDSNRAERKCYGADNVGNGIGDNWGSWLPECDVFDDPWCSPGGLGMDGATNGEDPDQRYDLDPERWSTGLTVEDLTISNTECGTALAFGGAEGLIEGVTIDTAGDHVHGPGCDPTDPDEPLGAWSDGVTMYGPAHTITDNVVKDASDIGIVTFGGRDTVIANNTIIATPGNHGMFGGIAVHPWGYGDVSGFEIVGNEVVNQADDACGGLHTGINIGSHMWGAGCVYAGASPAAVGQVGECSSVSPPPGWTLCAPDQPCRTWGYVPPGSTFTLTGNTVTGAQVNYLVEGLDVQGELVVSGNTSNGPRMTDWQDDVSCTWDGITDSWGTLDFVAHDPTIDGWTDQRIYCER
jgi:hypothetical protein